MLDDDLQLERLEEVDDQLAKLLVGDGLAAGQHALRRRYVLAWMRRVARDEEDEQPSEGQRAEGDDEEHALGIGVAPDGVKLIFPLPPGEPFGT